MRALGLMSGTSLDGVDAAIVDTDGVAARPLGLSHYLPYDARERDLLAAATTAARGAATADLRDRARWPEVIHQAEALTNASHLAACKALLARGGAEIVGFHGQTLVHRPKERFTLQIGDGASLARGLGLPVVYDFRSADVAAGGEGAPLAPFYHFALAPRGRAAAFLNIGGVANVTWINPAARAPEEPGALLAFDTGPGNGLINDWMMRHAGAAYDAEGAAAARGRIDAARLARLTDHPFFAQKPPKSLDRHAFSGAVFEGLSMEDGAATLTAFTAATVAAAAAHLPEAPGLWLVCGGGRKNAALMRMLAERLRGRVVPVEEIGADGDMLEAEAFGHLAARSLLGLALSCPETTRAPGPMTGGRLIYP